MKKSYVNKNFELLFEKEENKSEKIDNQITNFINSKRNALERHILSYKMKKENVEELYIDYVFLFNKINELTSDISEEEEDQICYLINSLSSVKAICVNMNAYIIETEDGKIEFSKIDELFPLIADKNLEKCETRQGKCHNDSIIFGTKMLDSYNVNNQIVTGYIYYGSDKSKYIHTWNEFNMSGKNYVLDYTCNIIMNKDGYYLLRHIKEKDIISKINIEDILKDHLKIIQISKGKECIDYKTYLTCRDEIMKDLEKNNDIFEQSREEK